jgi:hypothetical protein
LGKYAKAFCGAPQELLVSQVHALRNLDSKEVLQDKNHLAQKCQL